MRSAEGSHLPVVSFAREVVKVLALMQRVARPPACPPGGEAD